VQSGTRHREALAEGRFEAYIAWEAELPLGFVGLGACRDEDLDPKTAGEIWGLGYSAVLGAE